MYLQALGLQEHHVDDFFVRATSFGGYQVDLESINLTLASGSAYALPTFSFEETADLAFEGSACVIAGGHGVGGVVEDGGIAGFWGT